MSRYLPPIGALLATLFTAGFSTACHDEAWHEDDASEAEESQESQESFRLLANEICPNVLNDGLGLMRYCRSSNIYVDNPAIKRAIIVIHGTGLNAKDYYNTTRTEAVKAGLNLAEVDIIAPQYFEDYPAGNWANYYRWGGWRYGYHSIGIPRSSYAMIDHIIGQLADHRPNLETIVVAGQSAGGQFVDRYSIGAPDSPPGIDIRYWIVNPGSYLWHTSDRPDPDPTCVGFNDYHVGVNNRNAYMQQSTTAQLRQRAIERDIYWSVGADDTGGDTPCKYVVQGAHRYDRWFNHRQHIADVCNLAGYAPLLCVLHTSRHVEIPGVAHGHVDAWKSAEGHDILFGP